jgi:hypothetical protein
LSCRNRGEALPLEIFWKIEELPERIQKSIERLGLVSNGSSWTLEKLLSVFYESKKDLKNSTQKVYKSLGDLLCEFFGKDCRLGTIEKSECERFKKNHLLRYSSTSLARRIRYCRMIFRFAIDRDSFCDS